MRFVRTSRVFVLAGLTAFFAFSGDIVADSIVDVKGNHCVSQSSQSDNHHEKTPCSHCSCAVHNGAVVASNATVHVGASFEASDYFLTTDQSAPPPLPAAIDHPPQLS